MAGPRRRVQDQLARHSHRPFTDPWDFVDHVQQQKPGPDLATPPDRSRMLPQVPRRRQSIWLWV